MRRNTKSFIASINKFVSESNQYYCRIKRFNQLDLKLEAENNWEQDNIYCSPNTKHNDPQET